MKKIMKKIVIGLLMVLATGCSKDESNNNLNLIYTWNNSLLSSYFVLFALLLQDHTIISATQNGDSNKWELNQFAGLDVSWSQLLWLLLIEVQKLVDNYAIQAILILGSRETEDIKEIFLFGVPLED